LSYFPRKITTTSKGDLLPKNLSDALTMFVNLFKELCSKVLRVDDLDHLETQITITLCKLELKKFHLLALM